MTDADLNSAAKALAEELIHAIFSDSEWNRESEGVRNFRANTINRVILRHFTALSEQWEDGLAGTWWDDFNDLLAEVPKLRTELDAKEKRVKELETKCCKLQQFRDSIGPKGWAIRLFDQNDALRTERDQLTQQVRDFAAVLSRLRRLRITPRATQPERLTRPAVSAR